MVRVCRMRNARAMERSARFGSKAPGQGLDLSILQETACSRRALLFERSQLGGLKARLSYPRQIRPAASRRFHQAIKPRRPRPMLTPYIVMIIWRAFLAQRPPFWTLRVSPRSVMLEPAGLLLLVCACASVVCAGVYLVNSRRNSPAALQRRIAALKLRPRETYTMDEWLAVLHDEGARIRPMPSRCWPVVKCCCAISQKRRARVRFGFAARSALGGTLPSRHCAVDRDEGETAAGSARVPGTSEHGLGRSSPLALSRDGGNGGGATMRPRARCGATYAHGAVTIRVSRDGAALLDRSATMTRCANAINA